jgi:hypothetical protein
MVAFEAINNVRLVLRMTTGDHKGAADLVMTVTALPRNEPDGGQLSLGSASATCSGINLRTLEGALIQLMYRLDSKLAEGAFAKTLDK